MKHNSLPKISIIIPSFNKGSMVLATLKSISLSDYKGEIEIVLVDDKSSDSETLGSYESAVKDYKNLRFFVNKKKPKNSHGPASARNFGLSKATGELIVFVDSDDLVSTSFISGLVEDYLKHPEADFCYADLVLFDSQSLRLRKTPKFSADRLKIYNYIPVSFLVPKEKVLAIHGFDPDIFAMEDWDLILRLSLAGLRGKKIDSRLSFLLYRQDSPSSVNAGAFSARKRIVVRNQILKKNHLWGISSIFWNLAALVFSMLAKNQSKRESESYKSLPPAVRKSIEQTLERSISAGK